MLATTAGVYPEVRAVFDSELDERADRLCIFAERIEIEGRMYMRGPGFRIEVPSEARLFRWSRDDVGRWLFATLRAMVERGEL